MTDDTRLSALAKRAMKYEVGAFIVTYVVGVCFFGHSSTTFGYALTVYVVLCMFYILFHLNIKEDELPTP